VTGPFFGELYLRSTKPFLREPVTQAEVAWLDQRLRDAQVDGPVLDLGCGHGRHATPLRARGWQVVGLDFDALSLREAKAGAPVVRGDFFALPFRPHAFAAAFCWYNTLFTFPDPQQVELLRALVRCVKPGGLVVLQGTARAMAERHPEASYTSPLADGSVLEEKCHFDPRTGRDEIERRLKLPDGRSMAASFFIRYYDPAGIAALLEAAGLGVRWVHGGLDGASATEDSNELIIGAECRG
jgi:SAM-dependent methyltransferase